MGTIPDNLDGFGIAIAATFTAAPVEQSLGFWMHELEMPARISFAPYNQVFQQLLDPLSLLATNKNGLNVVLVRFEDWQRDTADPVAEAVDRNRFYQRIEANVRDLALALTTAIERSPVPYLICLCPVSPAEAADRERAMFFKRMEDLMVSELEGITGINLLPSAELAAAYPTADYYDPDADKLAHIPFTPVFFTALGTMIARKIYALKSIPYKVIVLDCDETLWSGVCGEDGPLGVQIDPVRKALQELMVSQHDAGMLLCLCSKNNEDEVLEVFARRPEMPLRPEHIVSRRINWRPKSENLESLAEELQLGLDSFIFIDDDPVECAEMQAYCPEVLTLQLPQHIATIPRFLRHIWAFDRLKVTEVAKGRTLLYKQNRKREHFRTESPTLKDFLAGLGLKIQISPVAQHQLSRVAELTQRTNQFNLTTVRRSELEIEELCRSGEKECLVVELKDRFGNYGLVGVILFQAHADAILVDTFLLSCRALGRGVEHRLLEKLGEIAKERGLKHVAVPFVPTKENQPALDFLEANGKDFKEQFGHGVLYRLPVEFAAVLSYRADPVEITRREPGSLPVTQAPATHTRAKASLLSWIAAEAFDAEQIYKRVSAQSRTRAGIKTPFVAPRTPFEEKVAGMFSELLGVEQLGVNDNFFELGGHSLLVASFMSQARKTFGVELSFGIFFEAPTVAGVALAILKSRATREDATTVAQLLKELGRLSEGEAEKRFYEEELYQTRMRPSLGDSSEGSEIAKEAEKSQPINNAIIPEQYFCADTVGLHADDRYSPTEIASIGLITCNRLESLKRALTSYIENGKEHGRTNDFIVMDDSASADVRNGYRQVLHSLGALYGVRIFYAGLEEKTRFANKLIKAGGLPPEVVNFALFDVEKSGYSYGANRNALLLDTTGDLIFSADDDTVCRVAIAPNFDNDIMLTSVSDPAEYWVFPDRKTALQSVTFDQKNILAIHEQLLGKGLDSIDAHSTQRLGPGEGRVLATFNGLVGDCGWGAPFGYWDRPIGYLLLDDKSHERLVRSEADYRSACTSREILRTVGRRTISDATYCRGTFMGLDNRETLPPFFPVQRGQDIIFGKTVWKSFPNGYFGHLPWTLLHSPVENRRFWPGEIFRSASGFDTVKLILACIGSFEPGSAKTDEKERLRSLGKHLTELGALSLQDFGQFVRAQTWHINSLFISLMEDRLRVCGELPGFWANDVKKYVEILRLALTRDDYCTPLDLTNGRSPYQARKLGQRLVLKFGNLLYRWPEIVEVARSLRAQGQRLADPV